MKTFHPEPVEHFPDKEPIMGFIIPKVDLPLLEQQIQAFTKGQHILALKEEGDKLRVGLVLFNPNPPQTLLQQIQHNVNKTLGDRSQIKMYAEFEQGDPVQIQFKPKKDKPYR